MLDSKNFGSQGLSICNHFGLEPILKISLTGLNLTRFFEQNSEIGLNSSWGIGGHAINSFLFLFACAMGQSYLQFSHLCPNSIKPFPSTNAVLDQLFIIQYYFLHLYFVYSLTLKNIIQKMIVFAPFKRKQMKTHCLPHPLHIYQKISLLLSNYSFNLTFELKIITFQKIPYFIHKDEFQSLFLVPHSCILGLLAFLSQLQFIYIVQWDEQRTNLLQHLNDKWRTLSTLTPKKAFLAALQMTLLVDLKQRNQFHFFKVGMEVMVVIMIQFPMKYMIIQSVDIIREYKQIQFPTIMRSRNNSVTESPVLLVCIYNQFGNIITHDYLYQLFCPYGAIVKILIFEKAKVWKTFIEYSQVQQAEKALVNLDNKVIFEDGSKMNIFRSKLKHVQFHNDNLGGVNYQSLKQQQQDSDHSNRKRRSTFQDYIVPFYTQQPMGQSYYNFLQKDYDQSSTSAKYKSQSLSAKKSKESSSFNNFMDIDEQFREIALESQQFRTWEQTTEINRRKSKTIVNPNSEQFLMENCPSKVLFARSLPQTFDHGCIYNIFSNFGKVSKVIFIKEKNSALIQFETQLSAIQAKDQINYVKPNFKVFYSHYQTLVLKKLDHNQEEFEYKSEGVARPPNCNPPSEILYMMMMSPNMQEQIRSLCKGLDCAVYQMEWKQSGKDKWTCLVQFGSLSQSLLVMGRLQGYEMSNGRKMRLSFTRSRLKRKNQYPYSQPFDVHVS